MNAGIPKLIAVLAVLLAAGSACAVMNMDVNVITPNTPLYISSNNSPTYDINFLVRSLTNYVTDVNADIWLSKGINPQTDLNYAIVEDLNIMVASTNFVCKAYQGGMDYNFYDANQMCRYRWTPAVANFPDGNWIVDVNVYSKTLFFVGVPVPDANSDRDWSDNNFTLDNTAPSCTISDPSASSASVKAGTIPLAFSATDANSGDIMEYYVSDGGSTYSSNGTTTTKVWNASEWLPVIHTYYVKARDHADNNCIADSVVVTFEASSSSTNACGDGSCGAGESAGTCAVDCPSACGDNVCTGTESPSNCPADCVTGCGNKMCEAGETCSSCESDCGSCPEQPTEPAQPTEPTQPSEPGTPEVVDACAGVTCNDNNPCTTDACYSGTCSSVAVANGTSCGYAKECRSGTCAAVSASAGEGTGAMGLDLTTLGLIVVVVVVLAGAYFFMVAKK